MFSPDNNFLATGSILVVLGAALAYMRSLPAKLWDMFERRFVVKLEVLDKEAAYEWVQLWLSRRLDQALSVSVHSRFDDDLRNGKPTRARFSNDRKKPTVFFVPSVGLHSFWYKGRLCIVNRSRNEGSPNPFGSESREKESFSIRIIGGTREMAKSFIEDCRDSAIVDDGLLAIHAISYSDWNQMAKVRKRPMDSVVLDGGGAERVRERIKRFLGDSDWYGKMGVPYRLGILFHGAPGSGKSSEVKAIASEFGFDVYYLSLSSMAVTDESIVGLFSSVPPHGILLLEDIDCAFKTRKKQPKTRDEHIGEMTNAMIGLPLDDEEPTTQRSSLTMSGLLNAMDGVASPDGRIVIMTTNYRDRLDPAMIRPGRVDMELEFRNASESQAERLFLRFFPGEEAKAKSFASLVGEEQHSMARLQQHLILNRDNADKAAVFTPLDEGEMAEELERQVDDAQPVTVSEFMG